MYYQSKRDPTDYSGSQFRIYAAPSSFTRKLTVSIKENIQELEAGVGVTPSGGSYEGTYAIEFLTVRPLRWPLPWLQVPAKAVSPTPASTSWIYLLNCHDQRMKS
jgi:hypothetical protein